MKKQVVKILAADMGHAQPALDFLFFMRCKSIHVQNPPPVKKTTVKSVNLVEIQICGQVSSLLRLKQYFP